jgi:capsular polysaccharide biosynthesis protein
VASQNQQAFRRWWWLVPIAIVIGLAGSFASLQLVQPGYRATCQLFVSVPPNTSPGESYQAAQFGQARVAAYLELIRGIRVATAAIDSMNIDMSPQDLVDHIDAHADAQSVVMNVSVTDSKSQRSADLTNAVCTQFLAVAADAEGPSSPINVRMIENATAPQKPMSPSRKRYLAAGAAAGLLAGFGLVILLGRLVLGDRQPKAEGMRSDLVATDGAESSSGEGDQNSAAGSHRRGVR